MGIQLVKVIEQGRGQFNNGEILENKPIGFPQDGGLLKPYSNLFYWAHAWTDIGSVIGEHPHHGFEILSFVLEGTIEHYDSKQNGWNVLNNGDAQVIRSGSGISHAEKLNKGAHMFQIWFDPDISKTVHQPATYNDYRNEEFSISMERGCRVKTYVGPGGIMNLDTSGILIREYSFALGKHSLSLDTRKFYSAFLINGEGEIFTDQEKCNLEKGDFFVIKELDHIDLVFHKLATLFVVGSDIKVPYMTYQYK